MKVNTIMFNNRILVIDDQKEVLDVYKTILEPHLDESRIQLAALEDDIFGETPTTLPIKESAWFEEECYNVVYANQGLIGIEEIVKSRHENKPFAVTFIDMRMPPGIDGKETAKRIRRIDNEIEIVIVTAYSDHNRKDIIDEIGNPSKILLLKKPFDIDEIKQFSLALTEKWNINYQRIQAELELKNYNLKLEKEVAERTDQLKDLVSKLEVLSNTDPLTGLFNFRKFQKQLELEISRIERFSERHSNQTSYTFSMAIIDIDNFKQINDTFGHLNGDIVLQTFALILKKNSRDIDIIARYGGDEFNLVYVDCPSTHAAIICRRISQQMLTAVKVRELFKNLDDLSKIDEILNKIGLAPDDYYPIRCSIGIVEYSHGLHLQDIIKRADSALYRVKRSGKDSLLIWSSNQNE